MGGGDGPFKDIFKEVLILSRLEAEGPMGAPEVSRALGVSASTVYSTLYRLSAYGLVERVGDRWAITERGAELLKRLKGVMLNK